MNNIQRHDMMNASWRRKSGFARGSARGGRIKVVDTFWKSCGPFWNLWWCGSAQMSSWDDKRHAPRHPETLEFRNRKHMAKLRRFYWVNGTLAMERKRENDKSAADRSLHSLRRRDCEKISGKTFFNHPPIAWPHLLRCAGPHYSSLFSSPSENPKGAGSAKTFLNMQIIRNQTDYYSSQ